MKFNKTFFLLYCAILISGFATALYGQDDDAKAIDELVSPFADAGHFSGVVLAARNGKIFYKKAFGPAVVGHNVANQATTKFGIASINKPMTAIILSRLVENGKIRVNEKLSEYIPDFPDGDKITIEMIAEHRSGIPHRVMPDREESKRFTTEEFTNIVKKAKLQFEPGSDELYSSAGYSVLARVLEIASGRPFDALLEEYVFSPSGMNDSIDFDSRKIIKNKAQSYFLEAEGYVAAPIKDYSYLVGAGSVFSTAQDLFKFGLAITEGDLGEAVRQNFVRQGVFRSNGSTNGFRSNLRIDTEKQIGYVVLSNLGSGANDIIISGLRKLLEGEEFVVPPIPKPKIDNRIDNTIADYPGRYKLGGSGFDILINDDQLYAGPFKLVPLGKDRFFSFWSYAEITFVRDPNGKVIGLKWVGSAGKSEWTKQ